MVERAHDAAERALAGIDPAAVVDVVNAEMLRALRVISVERGHDPRDFALVAFGGAGGWYLAVGANSEASAANGIDGDQLDESRPFAGAVFLY